MKKYFLLIIILFATISMQAQTSDAEGCKDNTLFPNRMPNYFISECSGNFDAVEFNLAAAGSQMIIKEGNKSVLRYDFNFESSQAKPSSLQIIRNYENATIKIGGSSLYFNAGEGLGTFKIVKSDKEVWIKIETGGSDNSDFYVVTILEIELMKQEISSNEIFTGLNRDGYIALYLNFATGKSTLENTSDKQIDQIYQMLMDNPSLKVSIEGHTDNEGNEKSNQTLSEERAKTVVNALVSKGIDKTRLSSKGWGQSKPIADNRTEDGKSKNRRVEIVKL